MNSSECPCQPHTEAQQEKHDAFLRQFEDSKAVMKNVANKYPDGTTSADLRDLELLGTGKPPFRAGSLSDDLDFDGMVKEASYRLFGTSTRDGRPLDNVNRPKFESVPLKDEVWEASFAKSLLHCYRYGFCLHCTSRIEEAGRDGKPGKEGQRILRSLLGLFDRTGEPIPRELRKWSEESRFQNPPKRKSRGRPGQNWLRDKCIIHTVATLAYLTDRKPTRNQKGEDGVSCCDAVAHASDENGQGGRTYGAVESVWTKPNRNVGVRGRTLLKRWRQQDRKEEQALTAGQADIRQVRAERRWARLTYWREQDWWDGV